jgi:hypothetical protein
MSLRRFEKQEQSTETRQGVKEPIIVKQVEQSARDFSLKEIEVGPNVVRVSDLSLSGIEVEQC